MSDQALGELLYEYTVQLTQMVEYGASMEAAPPPEGARFDGYFEGPVTGTKLSGSVKGVDYMHVRADGRFQLHIHAEITTNDGKKIALAADGVVSGEPPVLQVRENVTLTTSAPEYSWVNTIQVWGTGTVDLSKGEVRIKGYAA